MNRMTKMEKVLFLENYMLKITLTDGQSCIFDMKPKLKTVRFNELGRGDIFSTGALKNGQVICWSNGTELSLDEILPHHFTDKENIYE